MTLAAERWPGYDESATQSRRRGTLVVWRLELAKLARQIRVRTVAALCVLLPFAAVAAFNVQNQVPRDTLFGQWVHTSGYADPLVMLGFAGQWVLPALTAIVAGDIFSAEDHFGTWKTIVTRSRSRGQLFAGKLLAALTFAVTMMVIVVVAATLAGVAAGTQPIPGVSGQLIPSGTAAGLVALSWAAQIPPVLGFTALAVLLSVASRNSVAGIGGTVLAGLVLQIVSLVSLPLWLQSVFLSTPFVAWHGFWAQPAYLGPFWAGLITCAVWFALGIGISWLIFRRRTIGAA